MSFFLPTLLERRRRNPWAIDDFFELLTEKPNGMGTLKIDVQETPAEYVVKADLPGFQKKEIRVSLENHVLLLSAEHEESEEEKEETFIVRERSFRSMQRSIPLALAGASDNVKAEFKDGVLEIRVKKSPDKQTKCIPVN